MDAKLQRRIQRYGWDKAVDLYEQHWQQQLAPAQTRLLEMADIRPGERVLDVACGTGLVTCRVARQVGERGTVVGVDVAGKMVAYAQQVAASQHLRQVTWARMDAEELLLPDGTFDVALCALGLMYVPHPVKALQEMYRVLQPGGRAVAAVWGRRDRCGWADIFPIVDARVTTEVCPLFFHLGTQANTKHVSLLRERVDVVVGRHHEWARRAGRAGRVHDLPNDRLCVIERAFRSHPELLRSGHEVGFRRDRNFY